MGFGEHTAGRIENTQEEYLNFNEVPDLLINLIADNSVNPELLVHRRIFIEYIFDAFSNGNNLSLIQGGMILSGEQINFVVNRHFIEKLNKRFLRVLRDDDHQILYNPDQEGNPKRFYLFQLEPIGNSSRVVNIVVNKNVVKALIQISDAKSNKNKFQPRRSSS